MHRLNSANGVIADVHYFYLKFQSESFKDIKLEAAFLMDSLFFLPSNAKVELTAQSVLVYLLASKIYRLF
jgi:hypothetical protein